MTRVALSPAATAAAATAATAAGSTLCPLSTDTRSARISSALWYLPLGSLRIALATTVSSEAGTSELSAEGAGASVETCWNATDIGLSPVNGGLPVSIS